MAQSNMVYSLAASETGPAAMAKSDFPTIRFVTIAHDLSPRSGTPATAPHPASKDPHIFPGLRAAVLSSSAQGLAARSTG